MDAAGGPAERLRVFMSTMIIPSPVPMDRGIYGVK